MNIKKIFDGGNPSPLLNGLKCANTGAHFIIDGEYFEAMSKEFSKHRYNIISKYIRLYNEPFEKVELIGVLTNENDYEKMKFSIAFYKNVGDSQPYRHHVSPFKKWDLYYNRIRKAHQAIFKGKMMS